MAVKRVVTELEELDVEDLELEMELDGVCEDVTRRHCE